MLCGCSCTPTANNQPNHSHASNAPTTCEHALVWYSYTFKHVDDVDAKKGFLSAMIYSVRPSTQLVTRIHLPTYLPTTPTTPTTPACLPAWWNSGHPVRHPPPPTATYCSSACFLAPRWRPLTARPFIRTTLPVTTASLRAVITARGARPKTHLPHCCFSGMHCMQAPTQFERTCQVASTVVPGYACRAYVLRMYVSPMWTNRRPALI